jgi:hypothetical protein
MWEESIPLTILEGTQYANAAQDDSSEEVDDEDE